MFSRITVHVHTTYCNFNVFMWMETLKMVVFFVVKRYAVREVKKWRYAVRNAKIKRYAVRKGGGGCHPHKYFYIIFFIYQYRRFHILSRKRRTVDNFLYFIIYKSSLQWTWQFRVIDNSGSPLEKHICFSRMIKYWDILIIQSHFLISYLP